MAGDALGPGATVLGTDDRFHRRPAVVGHGGAEGPGAVGRYLGRHVCVGAVHRPVCPDPMAVPAHLGPVAGPVHRRLHPTAQRLGLCLRAGRLHRGDHCPAGHRPPIAGVRPGRGALHRDLPGYLLCHRQQCLALAHAGRAATGRPGPPGLAERPAGRQCHVGRRRRGAQRPAGKPGAYRCHRQPARTRLVRRQPRAPARSCHSRPEPETDGAAAHFPFGAPAVAAT
ncbi:hypothetical protein D3C79_794010 [compost metagenome]